MPCAPCLHMSASSNSSRTSCLRLWPFRRQTRGNASRARLSCGRRWMRSKAGRRRLPLMMSRGHCSSSTSISCPWEGIAGVRAAPRSAWPPCEPSRRGESCEHRLRHLRSPTSSRAWRSRLGAPQAMRGTGLSCDWLMDGLAWVREMQALGTTRGSSSRQRYGTDSRGMAVWRRATLPVPCARVQSRRAGSALRAGRPPSVRPCEPHWMRRAGASSWWAPTRRARLLGSRRLAQDHPCARGAGSCGCVSRSRAARWPTFAN